MSYEIETRPGPGDAADTGPLFILRDRDHGSRAEVWPDVGFNCLRWQARIDSAPVDLLWAEAESVRQSPTRSGIPVLFPFPNRIRQGRFEWHGRGFQLPINDPQGKNALHGFACSRPWRLLDHGASDDHAFITAIFDPQQAKDCRQLWPATYSCRLTWRLDRQSLAAEVEVTNTDTVALPFGVGFHPYFAMRPEQCSIVLPLEASRWHLEQCLPDGDRCPLSGKHALLHHPDLNSGLGQWHFDGAYRLGDGSAEVVVADAVRRFAVAMRCSAEFRDVVLFTPPHRQAVCVEPYTCVTDAVNLHRSGIDTGLLVLEPGQTWSGQVRWSIFSGETFDHWAESFAASP